MSFPDVEPKKSIDRCRLFLTVPLLQVILGNPFRRHTPERIPTACSVKVRSRLWRCPQLSVVFRCHVGTYVLILAPSKSRRNSKLSLCGGARQVPLETSWLGTCRINRKVPGEEQLRQSPDRVTIDRAASGDRNGDAARCILCTWHAAE